MRGQPRALLARMTVLDDCSAVKEMATIWPQLNHVAPSIASLEYASSESTPAACSMPAEVPIAGDRGRRSSDPPDAQQAFFHDSRFSPMIITTVDDVADLSCALPYARCSCQRFAVVDRLGVLKSHTLLV